jgi:hypothetical protein
MAPISTIPAILQPVIGQPIWGVKRSHGSFFLAEFGPVREILTLPARRFDNGRMVAERQVPRGRWSLMVELCRWRIEVGQAATSDLDADHAHMQAVMSALDGTSIRSIEIDPDVLTLHFSNDRRMTLGPAAYVLTGDTGSQWVIFFPDGSKLSRETDGRLSHER